MAAHKMRIKSTFKAERPAKNYTRILFKKNEQMANNLMNPSSCFMVPTPKWQTDDIMTLEERTLDRQATLVGIRALTTLRSNPPTTFLRI